MADYVYVSCSLPDPDVGPTVLVRDVELTSFHVGLCGRKFVMCLFDQCPGLCTICHSWQHSGVVYLSLQADDNVAFEEIPVFGFCRPACNVSSMEVHCQRLYDTNLSSTTYHLNIFKTKRRWDNCTYMFRPLQYRSRVWNDHTSRLV